MSIRQEVKSILIKYPAVWSKYQSLKSRALSFGMLRYFLNDLCQVSHYMHWRAKHKSQIQLSSELLFQYHKLEKGLVMPGTKRLFGVPVSKKVIELLAYWDFRGFDQDSPIRLGALETLHSYLNDIVAGNLDPKNEIVPIVSGFLASNTIRTPALSTPRPYSLNLEKFGGREAFSALVEARRSVRAFLASKPPIQLIRAAATLALQSPSACNRQPCRVYIVDDEKRKNDILLLQNGNRGFGHKIPMLAIITADAQVFFDASERHEPYVDGGLFSMSFMYALTSQGLASCCLNWCVSPSTDQKLRKQLPLSESESVIMLMAIGYPDDDLLVPRSPRRSLGEVLIEIQ